MRDAVGEVNRAVDGIDNPAMFRLDIAGHAFLAQNGDLWIRGAQRFLDQLLASHVQFEFDVVLRREVDLFL